MPQHSPKHKLTRHPRGSWYKSINGRWTMVAGKREAPDGKAADAVYEARFSVLWNKAAGGRGGFALSLADGLDQFLAAKQAAVRTGNLEDRTCREYAACLQDLSDMLGAETIIAHLSPMDFTGVHQAWSARFGVHRLSKYVSIVRTAFKWLADNGFIDAVPAYGDFRQPTRAAFRRHLARREEEQGERLFAPGEIARLLDKADAVLRACILLALNCGFGNTDLSRLRLRAVDLNAGWIDFRRTKTAVKRRCPLWPETIEAIQAALPLCKITGNVFSTSDGRPLVQRTHDRLAVRFKTLCRKADCYIEDRGFYALRHTFATAAVLHGPTILVKRITGHTSSEEDRILDEHYVGQVDAGLLEIVNGVHHLISEWSGARSGACDAKQGGRPAGRLRPGTLRSGGEGIESRARTAPRRSSRRGEGEAAPKG